MSVSSSSLRFELKPYGTNWSDPMGLACKARACDHQPLDAEEIASAVRRRNTRSCPDRHATHRVAAPRSRTIEPHERRTRVGCRFSRCRWHWRACRQTPRQPPSPTSTNSSYDRASPRHRCVHRRRGDNKHWCPSRRISSRRRDGRSGRASRSRVPGREGDTG